MSLALVLLAGLVAVAWMPGRAVRPPAAGDSVVAAEPATGVPAGAATGRRWLARVRRGRRRTPDLAVVVTEVASRLRTGATPEAAWEATVERLLGSARPGEWEELLGPARPGEWEDGASEVPPALGRLVAHCAPDPGARAAARTVVAASRLTQRLGAPLADVLDRCAATVTEVELARDDRRVALAGPRSTARILAGLPLLGLLLGAGLGADPLGAATDGGWGTVSVVLGLVLLGIGRRWTMMLVSAAEGTSGKGGRRSRQAREEKQAVGEEAKR